SVLLVRGHIREALVHLRKAVDLHPDRPEFHHRLAETLKRSGQLVASRNVYYRLHEQARPDLRSSAAKWLRRADHLLWRDGRLPAILRCEAQPSSPAERVALAEVALLRGLHVAAVRLFEEAFAAAPGLANKVNSHRYNAACAAALAAASKGSD